MLRPVPFPPILGQRLPILLQFRPLCRLIHPKTADDLGIYVLSGVTTHDVGRSIDAKGDIDRFHA